MRNTAYSVYGKFVVDDENNKYKLSVADYDESSTAGDSLYLNNNWSFSTKDRDNFNFGNTNPADYHKGGWWYIIVSSSNLNGLYLGRATNPNGMVWSRWKGRYQSLKRSEMKLRPSSFV